MDCAFRKGEIISFGSDVFVIEDIIGRGASSIVYRAKHQKKCTEHLLKEYNPQGMELYRDSLNVLHINNKSDREKFDDGLVRFTASYELQRKLREDAILKNSICNIQGFHEGYGTKFIEMTVFSGQSYDKIEEKTLKDLLLRIKAITKTVSRFHSKGYLLLDIKPANIFTIPENIETIMLFDFDSVVSLADLSKSKDWNPSSTLGWYAPELKDHADRKNTIEAKTDIYSIGMILYAKLTGKTLETGTKTPKKLNIPLDPTVGLLKDVDISVLDPLVEMLSHTLCCITYRWRAEEFIRKLEEIIKKLDRLEDASLEQAQSASSATIQVQVNVDKDDRVEKQLSKLHRTIIAAAVLICIPIFLLLFGSLLSDSKAPASSTSDTTQMEQLQQPEQTDVVVELTANMQTETSPTAITEAPTTMPTQDIEESMSPSTPHNENSRAYTIDTIAYTSENFRSLIVTNDGVVYYLDGSVVFNSADNVSLDIATILAQPLEYSYLAYDPYHDIVYLLTGESLTIYDITDLSNPLLVMDNSICSTMSQLELDHILPVAPQIPVLSDGSLLVPTYVSGTYRVDVVNKRFAKFEYVYNLQSSYYGFENLYSRVIGDYILELRKDSKEATIIPLNGTPPSIVQLELEPPHWCEVWATQDGLLFYVDGIGVCQIQIDGTANILIPQGQITINDYQSLDRNDILAFAANENGIVAFYDYSLNGIRLISPEQ